MSNTSRTVTTFKSTSSTRESRNPNRALNIYVDERKRADGFDDDFNATSSEAFIKITVRNRENPDLAQEFALRNFRVSLPIGVTSTQIVLASPRTYDNHLISQCQEFQAKIAGIRNALHEADADYATVITKLDEQYGIDVLSDTFGETISINEDDNLDEDDDIPSDLA